MKKKGCPRCGGNHAKSDCTYPQQSCPFTFGNGTKCANDHLLKIFKIVRMFTVQHKLDSVQDLHPKLNAVFGKLALVAFATLYLGHVAWYADYSHGLRLVDGTAHVDGRPLPLADVPCTLHDCLDPER